jgi:hypothetical protein
VKLSKSIQIEWLNSCQKFVGQNSMDFSCTSFLPLLYLWVSYFTDENTVVLRNTVAVYNPNRFGCHRFIVVYDVKTTVGNQQ